MKKLIVTLVSAALFAPQAPTHAQSYPSRPIRLVTAFGPGSASDHLARITGQELTASMGQPIVVVHKPGADGAISALEVKRATADGYTFLFGTNSPLAVVLKHVQEKPASPQSKNPKIDPKVAAIILRCMQKEPSERYQSINELYESLARITAAAA